MQRTLVRAIELLQFAIVWQRVMTLHLAVDQQAIWYVLTKIADNLPGTDVLVHLQRHMP